jgi:hypothetical protein
MTHQETSARLFSRHSAVKAGRLKTLRKMKSLRGNQFAEKIPAPVDDTGAGKE